MALKPVVFQHFSNFVICKSKVFIEIRIGNGVYGHIVQAGEDALLGYTQAAGQHSKKQAVIGFQCRSKHSADQVDHALIVTVLIGFVQRNVVFVNEQNNLLTIMLFQKDA